MAEQLDRSRDQRDPEHQEHERERREQRGAERDEDRSEHEREADAERERARLVLGGHRERAHDDHEHEQVVDRQALLDHVAGEELRAEAPSREQSKRGSERERRSDVEERPDGGRAKAHRSGPQGSTSPCRIA